MPSGEHPRPVLDDDHVDGPPGKPDSEAVGAQAIALAEEAEAEAAEAEALAAAARARARAIRLRRQAETTEPAIPEDVDPTGVTDTETDTGADSAEVDAVDTTEVDAEIDAEPVAEQVSAAKGRRFRRPGWTTVAAGIAVLCTCALLAASAYMTWHHRQAVGEQQRAAEFAAAARQIVVTLMSIDSTKAKDDVQRIIDSSTGQFRDDFQSAADDFIKVSQDAKVSTKATVQGAAVESMTDDSAVVLVAARSTVTNAAGANEEPRSWRLSVNLARDGGQIKMSSLEFVP